jgi:hypothetical protein
MHKLMFASALLWIAAMFGCGTNNKGGGLDGGGGASADMIAATDPTASFLGAWKVTSGTTTVSCTGQPPQPQDDRDNSFKITKDTTAGGIVFTSDGMAACTFKLTVSGNGAAATSGQSCGPAGMMLSIQSASIATSDGKTATFTMTASGQAPDGMGGTITCTLSTNDTAAHQ